MIPASDRHQIIALIEEALDARARQAAACAELDIDPHTMQRWRSSDGTIQEDQCPLTQRPAPANKLSVEERCWILTICNSEAFASLPPAQIVPRLADEGIYI